MRSPPTPSAKINSLRVILAASAVGLNLLPLRHSGTGAPRSPAFVIGEAVATVSAGDPRDFCEEVIAPAMETPTAHVASVCELPGGRLGATWYGGTEEAHEDVAIYFSTRSQGAAGGWSRPQAVVTRASAAAELQRHIMKVGNAVTFADARGGVWLVYVSMAASGWSSSSLNLKRSFDSGRTWTPSRRLTLSPFFNISELVKNKPATLVGGGWVLPIYHEAAGIFPELLWLREEAGGVSAVKTRIFGGRAAFQPSLVPFGADEALALCRPAEGSRTILLSRTGDAGRHWSAPRSTGLPNPGSGLDALRLFDGRLLLAFNDSEVGRDTLRLAISHDNGTSWTRAATVAAEPGGDLSYPSLMQSADGRIHLVYAWNRKAIRHLSFSLAWLSSHNAAPIIP